MAYDHTRCGSAKSARSVSACHRWYAAYGESYGLIGRLPPVIMSRTALRACLRSSRSLHAPPAVICATVHWPPKRISSRSEP